MPEMYPFRGVYTALVTPMHEDGAIDWETLGSLVEAQVSAGVNGLVPVGTTGESPTLDAGEHIAVITAVVEQVNGRVPVIAGTGANSTAEALHLTREADLAGADAFLQVAPYYNKPTQEGIFRHFEAIARSTDKPIMLYSIPGRCGVEIAVETVARLATACPNVCCIKEAGGDVRRVGELRTACPDVTVLSGDDGLILPFIKAGANGVVSVAANLAPDIIRTIANSCLEGDWTQSEKLAAEWQNLLTDLVFIEGNPVTIKEVLYRSGRIPSPTLRLPLVRMSEPNQKRVAEMLDSLQSSIA